MNGYLTPFSAPGLSRARRVVAPQALLPEEEEIKPRVATVAKPLSRADQLRAAGFPMLAAMEDHALQRAEAQAGDIVPDLGFYSRIEDAGKEAPLPNVNMDSTQLLRAQLAGDSFGDVNRFLRKRAMNSRLEADPADKSRPMDEILLSQTLRPYGEYDHEGSPGLLDKNKNPSRLDRVIYDDQDFQALLAKNPTRAKHLYRRLKGRELDDDLKIEDATTDAIRTQGINVAGRLLGSGDAVHDPLTNTWMTRQRSRVPDPTDPTKERVTEMMAPANQYENQVLNAHAGMFGLKTEDWSQLKSTKRVLQNLQTYRNDPEFQSFYSRRVAQKGGQLNAAEIDDMIMEYTGMKFQQENQPKWYNHLLEEPKGWFDKATDKVAEGLDYLMPRNSDGSFKTRDDYNREERARFDSEQALLEELRKNPNKYPPRAPIPL